jgi:pyruvate carboxylase
VSLAGVDIFRVFDSLNYVDNMKFGIDTVLAAGGICEGTLCYTGDVSDPKCRYNLDYYLALAEEMVNHGCHSLAIKDMAGLLKPRAATLLVRHPQPKQTHWKLCVVRIFSFVINKQKRKKCVYCVFFCTCKFVDTHSLPTIY